jgi:hypothetical protein
MRTTNPTGNPTRRLQFVLVLMIVWEVLAILAELSFGGPLFEVSGDEIDGLLGARSGFGGLAAVPLAIYLFVLLRGPMRYAGLLWVGVIQYGASALFIVYHLARGHVAVEASILPLVFAGALLVLLLINLPRNEAVGAA